MAEHANRERADRILDAAGELLVRMGYRKVAIEDIARAAGIGKGTVYLHWRTKERLFQALLQRETVELVDELVARLAEDPHEVLPHRHLRTSFLATVRRPLMAAILTRDAELLGTHARTSPTGGEDALAAEEIFGILIRHGLLRADIPNVRFATNAAALGYYVHQNFTDEYAGIDVQAKADALAHTIRTAFEPPGEPDPAVVVAAARELGAVLTKFNAAHRAAIYSPAHVTPSA
ncbi:TetR/AcrR family transcriptional regulator [Amycolatopsis sp. MEPSY49]|uniref:TetR/AcrR family transcriptional regulator n=1 Tax=Amycolatopsis sp. MEPSY49 TaxID=3151600 RepID=UPI003EF9E1AE